MERKLGRGLNSLMSRIEGSLKTSEQSGRVDVEIASIKRNPYQPRVEFKDEKISELAQSIEKNGLLQPVLVRKIESGYELIAGERRLRAVKSLGWVRVTCNVREATDQQMAVLALIENLQREDLDPIEKARAFKDLSEKNKMSQEQIAEMIGVDRSTIANFIRLLSLPEKIKEGVSRGTITMGHARALLSVESRNDRISLYNRIVSSGLSVRQCEKLTSEKKHSRAPKSADHKAIEEKISAAMGARVEIKNGKRKSKLIIDFYSNEDLSRILNRLGVS